jgi:hypothetical protein
MYQCHGLARVNLLASSSIHLIHYIEFMVAQSSTITVPNDISYLPAIQAYAWEIAKQLGF